MFLSDRNDRAFDGSRVGCYLDATNYKTGPNEERTKVNETVGSVPTRISTYNAKSNENDKVRERSRQGQGARLTRRLGRKKVWDRDTMNTHEPRPELAATRPWPGAAMTRTHCCCTTGRRTTVGWRREQRPTGFPPLGLRRSAARQVSIRSCT